MSQIGVRWTIGNVSSRGFQALRLSILGAWKMFGPSARYAVCVNSLKLDLARVRTGTVPEAVEWIEVPAPGYSGEPAGELAMPLPEFLDDSMAGGVAWKLFPLRVFPDLWELSLDNDCILWQTPQAITRWLDESKACLLAADIAPSFGEFEGKCPCMGINTSIRGFPPGFDPGCALQIMWERRPVVLKRVADERGFQVAAYLRAGRVHVVSLEEVTICSPFRPHHENLGSCGAHFVGLNARHIPWTYYGRSALECLAEHWDHHRRRIESLVR